MNKKINVVSKTDTVHPKYGKLKIGMELEIDPEDFGDQIFKRKTEKPANPKPQGGK